MKNDFRITSSKEFFAKKDEEVILNVPLLPMFNPWFVATEGCHVINESKLSLAEWIKLHEEFVKQHPPLGK